MNAYGTAGEEGVLAAVRQEVSKLREVFVVIQDALVAAVERLEGLENHLGADGTEADGADGADDAAPGAVPAGASLSSLSGDSRIRMRRGPRPLPSWKVRPAGRSEPAAGAAGERAAAAERATGGAVTADTLRARREALGISQAAVAHAAHCSRGLVAEVERGKRTCAPTLAHLAATLDKLEALERRS